MAIAGISLGSNLGNRAGNLEAGIRRLKSSGIEIIRESKVLETVPLGFKSEQNFFNQCILVKSDLQAPLLLDILMQVEQESGRIRIPGRIDNRSLDLDLLFYDDLIIKTKRLALPHPRMHERLFVLEPLLEIFPDWQHPVLGLSIAEMIEKVQNINQ